MGTSGRSALRSPAEPCGALSTVVECSSCGYILPSSSQPPIKAANGSAAKPSGLNFLYWLIQGTVKALLTSINSLWTATYPATVVGSCSSVYLLAMNVLSAV